MRSCFDDSVVQPELVQPILHDLLDLGEVLIRLFSLSELSSGLLHPDDIFMGLQSELGRVVRPGLPAASAAPTPVVVAGSAAAAGSLDTCPSASAAGTTGAGGALREFVAGHGLCFFLPQDVGKVPAVAVELFTRLGVVALVG